MNKIINYLLCIFITYIGMSSLLMIYFLLETDDFISSFKGDCFSFSVSMICMIITNIFLFLSLSGKIFCKFCNNNINCGICDCISFILYCFVNFYYFVLVVNDINSNLTCTKYYNKFGNNLMTFFNVNMIVCLSSMFLVIAYILLSVCYDISECFKKKNTNKYTDLEN